MADNSSTSVQDVSRVELSSTHFGQPGAGVSRWMRPMSMGTAVLPAVHPSHNGSNGLNGSNKLLPTKEAPVGLLPVELLRRQRQPATRPPSASRNLQSFCEWCRQPLGPRNHSGRKRVYCSQSCRQRAYQSRKRSKQLGLRDGELVVSSVLLARMNRRLKALENALADVEAGELHLTDQRIAELCQAARRLRRLVVGPPTR